MKFKRRAMKADVPSVAMGDIAFNLLIFFVILAKAQDDSHLQWQPAQAKQLQGFASSKASVLIDRENKLHLNGKEIGQAQLAKGVGDILGSAPQGDRTVLLKVHKDATAMYYEAVIEAISEAGGDLVHVLEEKQ